MPKSVKRLLQATSITFLGIAGAMGILLIILIVVNSLRGYLQTPADFLPEEETIALFIHTDSETVQRFNAWIPPLEISPPFTLPHTLAVLRLPNGKMGIALFRRRSESRGSPEEESLQAWEMRQLGAYTVQVSSGEVWGMLSAEQPARLSDSKDFRLLSWGKTGNQSWQFLRSDTLPPPLSPGDDVLSTTLLSGVTHFARTEQERGRALFELAGPSLSGSPSLLPLFPSGSSSLLSLSLSSPAEIWQQVTSALPTSKRLVLESNVLTLVASVFGDAVSLEFDVLPLLGEGTTLEIKKTSSGAIAFLLAGSADEEILPGKIDQLHTSFGVSLTTVRVVTRVLENGRFIAQNIRDDATVFEGEGYDNGQWHIRSTVSTQGRKGLFSATMEERFLLSNNEDLLREGMTASLSSPSSPSPQSSTALAQGTFAPTGISALFGDSLPSLLRFFSPSPTPSAFRWSLERRGDVTALSIRPLPSAKN